MKNHSFSLSLITAIFVQTSISVFSQTDSDKGFRQQDGSFIPSPFSSKDQLTLSEYDNIKQNIRESRDMLLKQGKLNYKQLNSVTFELPVKLKDGINSPGFYSISAYVDHDTAAPNHLLDYNCGIQTYDLDNGYNHGGTDYFSWPFNWYNMDHDYIEIIAAAPGTIIYKQDGNYDRNCDAVSATWNAIYIEHADGSIAWYGHLKDGSITSKSIGEQVVTGEYLGIMGSSGRSSGPHLHYEIYDSSGVNIDPYEGMCNNTISASWWNSQEPYQYSELIKLATHDKLPVFPPCPGQETPNYSDYFLKNDTVFIICYFKNSFPGDTVNYHVYRPNASLWSEWTWVSEWPYYSASYLYYWIKLGDSELSGNWKVTVDYKGESFDHYFYLGNSNIEDGKYPTASLFPNPAKDYVSVQLPGNAEKISDVTLRDVTGRVLLCRKIECNKNFHFIVNISDYSGGTYFITVCNGEIIQTQKLIISK